ncbi:MAG: hypothetical protein A2283_04260 [Lentisphaerae bacterium RIFOXYA12_FULL_48_11]|nr:MAG: hypothetical protein A2283_04260 [Lentisphaerae bacterium RIFOXYA12_FULL_48_11]
MEIASKKNIAIVEDSAHALGTQYKGKHVGQRGTSIYSFHPIKNITTGEGGMICSDDRTLLDCARRLRFHGLGVNAFDRKIQGRDPNAEVLEPGYKYNLTDISAALGISQLVRINAFILKRTELAMLYRKLLTEIPEINPLHDPPYSIKHAWHLFIVRVDTDKTGMSRDDFMIRLKEKNIGTGLHFRAVHLHKYYMNSMEMRRGMLPDTEWNSDRICSLPLFPDMTPDDVNDVVNAIKEVLKKG